MVERIDKEDGALLAKGEIDRAGEELNAAKSLQGNGFFFKSVVSAYYATYHAAKALLLLKGVAPKTHEGVERMFGLYYIKTKEFDLTAGKSLGRLMKMREEADYYPDVPFTADEAAEAIKAAKDFLEKARLRFKT
ncbi:MAG: HEPN domain-containing protein [Nitrospirae bacterium]|nr:HEPN domain-containing protein [Nitrospirota bacterium]